MLSYSAKLKSRARELRKNQTDSESLLWEHLRGKQLVGVQFYRQKPIGNYIVDFFAPSVKLVIEVDGSQHMESKHLHKDKKRDDFLVGLGLEILRFDSRVVLTETEAVLEIIFRKIIDQQDSKIPPPPPFSKGGTRKEII
jgi:very-short-patch-repair endonuclease